MKKWKTEEKVIFNIFLCPYATNNKKWVDYIEIFKNLNVDWWVKPNAGNPLGLAYQSILNTDDINEAIKISNYIFEKFDNDVLIVISKNFVRNFEPVGMNNEDAFIGCGRYFDKLVKNNKKGIFVY
jgi:hypothetical protein